MKWVCLLEKLQRQLKIKWDRFENWWKITLFTLVLIVIRHMTQPERSLVIEHRDSVYPTTQQGRALFK